MAQYTTFVNQFKDASNQPVNIGLHYVALAADGNPIDTDGDGWPDYAEDVNGNGLADCGEGNWRAGDNPIQSENVRTGTTNWMLVNPTSLRAVTNIVKVPAT